MATLCKTNEKVVTRRLLPVFWHLSARRRFRFCVHGGQTCRGDRGRKPFADTGAPPVGGCCQRLGVATAEAPAGTRKTEGKMMVQGIGLLTTSLSRQLHPRSPHSRDCTKIEIASKKSPAVRLARGLIKNRRLRAIERKSEKCRGTRSDYSSANFLHSAYLLSGISSYLHHQNSALYKGQ